MSNEHWGMGSSPRSPKTIICFLSAGDPMYSPTRDPPYTSEIHTPSGSWPNLKARIEGLSYSLVNIHVDDPEKSKGLAAIGPWEFQIHLQSWPNTPWVCPFIFFHLYLFICLIYLLDLITNKTINIFFNKFRKHKINIIFFLFSYFCK